MKQLFTTAFLLLATLNAQALDSGAYAYDNGADTTINVYTNVISIESTWQVAGAFVPEVPFPTMCRIRKWGHVRLENREGFVVEVKIHELGDSSDLPNSEACRLFVNGYNEFISKHPLKLYYHKSGLKKLEKKSSQ